MAMIWGQTTVAQKQDTPEIERCLTLFAEGAASGMPEVDSPSYKAFREAVSSMARQIPDRLADEDRLPVVKNILREFETYRNGAEVSLRSRQAGWRALTLTLLRELLTTIGIDPGATSAAPLSNRIANLVTGEEIQAFTAALDNFLHPAGSGSLTEHASVLRVADHSTANLNAAGLRGGGAAVRHVEKIMAEGGVGFVVVFRLGCLEVISQRFGFDAVQDCLMAVSAFLIHSLHSDDAIYHWSDSSLLAVVGPRANEQILSAELQRIMAKNRDITIQVNGRTVMLRIPLQFEITPIKCFESADDVNKLSRGPATRW